MIDERTVNSWLLKAAQKYVRVVDPSTIFVGEVVFPCLRAAYFNRVRAPRPSPVEALKSLGTEIHRMIQDVLKEEGWEAEVGLGLELEGFKLVGRADAVRFNDEGMPAEVLEIKTVNGEKSEPLQSHVLQLQVYMELLNARRGTLIYIDRASGRVKVFAVRRNPSALESVKRRAATLHKALTKHEPPPAVTGPWCAVCPHKDRCGWRW